MGSIQSKNKKTPCEKDIKGFREKVRLLEKEMREIMLMRENESEAHEQERMMYGLKEAEWRRERKRLREEVKRLRKVVEEREEEILVGEKKREKEEWWECQLREERARRDEAVEKWKKLYLAIKIELDDLIERTHQGEKLYWRAEEEELMEELQRELKAKEETIEILQARFASMEQEQFKRERDIDILRQSLRIISNNNKKKKPTVTIGNGKCLSSKKLAYL